MTSRKIVTALLLTVITVSGTAILLNSALAADGIQGQDSSQTAQTEVTALKVKTASVSAQHTSEIDLVGTIKANDQVRVFASSAGQLAKTLVSEGQSVKKGDPLFVIGGINGEKPVSLIQMEIAQKNYDAARQGLELTEKGNAASLNAAELQLASARHAAEGASLDLQVIDQNINGVNHGLFYLNDSLYATSTNNDLSLEKARDGMDTLIDSIDSLERQKSDLEDTIDRMNDSQEDTTELSSQLSELESTIEDLYSQLDSARTGYKQLEQAKTLSENQILAQIAQTKTQGTVLNLNRNSAETKMGLTADGVTDAVKLAEEGVNAAKVKNQASLLQARTQLSLAESNLEMAKIQADSLVVRSPVDGVVGEISANVGDLVSQQSMLTQVSGLNDYELRTAVDADTADLIKAGGHAEVMIGGRYMESTIKSISPIADPATKLVSVSIALPKVKFRANDTLNVRLQLTHGGTSADAGSFFIPLDALIIGTEEKYVFVVNEGKAQRKVVETGEVRGDQVEITAGLKENDIIITDGSKAVLENQPVEIIQ